jgi:hypothetical protein
MKFILMALTVALVSCQSPGPRPTVWHLAPLRVPAQLVFPYGHYRHEVTLHLLHGGASDFEFQGVVASSSGNLELVMLSPFGTTLMKMREDRQSGEVTADIYDARIQRYKDKIMEYYELMRRVLLLERATPVNDQLTAELALAHPAKVSLTQFKDGIPRKAQVLDSQFKLNIEVEPLDEATH